MDPLTAALALANSAIGLLTKMFDAMDPEQKKQFNKPFLDSLTRWNDFLNVMAGIKLPT